MTHSGRAGRIGATVLFLLGVATVSCRGRETPQQASAPAAEEPATSLPETTRAILRLHPATAAAGAVFSRQPNGNSAISVVGAGFTRGDKVHWAGQTLMTVFGGETTLTAEVPAALLSQPGDIIVSVKDPADSQSPEVQATFRVLPRGEP
jgi:hypothetical protein